jgi:competence ComEA-like helix-hairpin-helix protein
MNAGKYFREWFSFSRSEKNGIAVVLVLILVVSLLNAFKGYFVTERVKDFTEFETRITQMEWELKNASQKESQNSVADTIVLFEFDPNTVSAADFEKLGFSRKNAESLLKFREKKGKFYKKEDFRKLYFVNDSIYAVYEAYVNIERDYPDYEKKEYRQYEKEKKELITVELNSADTTQLEKLPGIGPSFAKRIVKYRERLGGFGSPLQLKEVYGFTEEMYERLKEQVYVNTSLVTRINVNTATFRDLIRHPYMTKEKVIRILDFRDVMKRINNMDELVKNKIIDPEDSEKLNPYFGFD